MKTNKNLTKYFDSKYETIKKININNAITIKDEFIEILEVWELNNRYKGEIQIGNQDFGKTPLLWVKLSNKLYYLNSDTKYSGVKEFLFNKDEQWQIIENRNGRRNKVTNKDDSKGIKGFYFYLKD
jgi:hypothetical protein